MTTQHENNCRAVPQARQQLRGIEETMSDRQRDRAGREPAVVHEGGAVAVADGGRREVRPIGKAAKSRRYLHDRLNSSRCYAHFAAAAGEDLFDGEPIERFAAVGKLDERTLRMRAQELREDIFAEALRQRSLPAAAPAAIKE